MPLSIQGSQTIYSYINDYQNTFVNSNLSIEKSVSYRYQFVLQNIMDSQYVIDDDEMGHSMTMNNFDQNKNDHEQQLASSNY